MAITIHINTGNMEGKTQMQGRETLQGKVGKENQIQYFDNFASTCITLHDFRRICSGCVKISWMHEICSAKSESAEVV